MKDKNETKKNEEVPAFSSWNAWYILVLSTLVFLIILFFIFTISFD